VRRQATQRTARHRSNPTTVSFQRNRPPPRFYKLDEGKVFRLAQDPAHGNRLTNNGRDEAVIGLTLETLGYLPGPIVREPSGKAEFVDAKGTQWDVKRFNSHWPIRTGGFELVRAMQQLVDQIQAGENVIIDTTNLKRLDWARLRAQVKQQEWADRILWYPPPRNLTRPRPGSP
jgi:hypothetical protein